MDILPTQIYNLNDFSTEQKKNSGENDNNKNLNEDFFYRLLQKKKEEAKKNRKKNSNIDKIKKNIYLDDVSQHYYLILDENKKNVEKLYVKYTSNNVENNPSTTVLIEEYIVENQEIKELFNSYLQEQKINQVEENLQYYKGEGECYELDSFFYFDDDFDQNEEVVAQTNWFEKFSQGIQNIPYKHIRKCLYNDNFPDVIITEDFMNENKKDIIKNVKIYGSETGYKDYVMNKSNHLNFLKTYMMTKYKSYKIFSESSNSNFSPHENIAFSFLPVYIFQLDGTNIARIYIHLCEGKIIKIDESLMQNYQNFLKCVLVCGGFDIDKLGDNLDNEENLTNALINQIETNSAFKQVTPVTYFTVKKSSELYEFKPYCMYREMSNNNGNDNNEPKLEDELVWDGLNYYYFSQDKKRFLTQSEINGIGNGFDYYNNAFGIDFKETLSDNELFSKLKKDLNLKNVFDEWESLEEYDKNKYGDKKNELENFISSYQKNMNQEKYKLKYETAKDVVKDEKNKICFKERKIYVDDLDIENDKLKRYAVFDLYYKYDSYGNKIYKNIVLIKNRESSYSQKQLEEELKSGKIGSDKRLHELKIIYLHNKKEKEFEIFYELSINNNDFFPLKFYFLDNFDEFLCDINDEENQKLNELRFLQNNSYEISEIYLFKPEFVKEQNPQDNNGKIGLNISLPIVLLKNIKNPEKKIIAVFNGTDDYMTLQIKDLYEKNNDESEEEIKIKEDYKRMIDPRNIVIEVIDNENLVKTYLNDILKPFIKIDYNIAECLENYEFISIENLDVLPHDYENIKDDLKENRIKFLCMDNGMEFCLTFDNDAENFSIEFLDKNVDKKSLINPIFKTDHEGLSEANLNKLYEKNQQQPIQENLNFISSDLAERIKRYEESIQLEENEDLSEKDEKESEITDKEEFDDNNLEGIYDSKLDEIKKKENLSKKDEKKNKKEGIKKLKNKILEKKSTAKQYSGLKKIKVTYEGEESEEKVKKRKKLEKSIESDGGVIYGNLKSHIIFEKDGEFCCDLIDHSMGGFIFSYYPSNEIEPLCLKENWDEKDEDIYMKEGFFTITPDSKRKQHNLTYNIYKNIKGEYKLHLNEIKEYNIEEFKNDFGFDVKDISERDLIKLENEGYFLMEIKDEFGTKNYEMELVIVEKNGISLFYMIDRKTKNIYYVNSILKEQIKKDNNSSISVNLIKLKDIEKNEEYCRKNNKECSMDEIIKFGTIKNIKYKNKTNQNKNTVQKDFYLLFSKLLKKNNNKNIKSFEKKGKKFIWA